MRKIYYAKFVVLEMVFEFLCFQLVDRRFKSDFQVIMKKQMLIKSSIKIMTCLSARTKETKQRIQLNLESDC